MPGQYYPIPRVLFFFFFLRYAGLSLSRPLPLRSAGSAAMAHGPSRSAACGIFPDQGTNPRHLHRQADSQPLHHQGSPLGFFFSFKLKFLGFPGGAVVGSPPADAGDAGSCPVPGRSHMPRSGWAREPWLIRVVATLNQFFRKCLSEDCWL